MWYFIPLSENSQAAPTHLVSPSPRWLCDRSSDVSKVFDARSPALTSVLDILLAVHAGSDWATAVRAAVAPRLLRPPTTSIRARRGAQVRAPSSMRRGARAALEVGSGLAGCACCRMRGARTISAAEICHETTLCPRRSVASWDAAVEGDQPEPQLRRRQRHSRGASSTIGRRASTRGAAPSLRRGQRRAGRDPPKARARTTHDAPPVITVTHGNQDGCIPLCIPLPNTKGGAEVELGLQTNAGARSKVCVVRMIVWARRPARRP